MRRSVFGEFLFSFVGVLRQVQGFLGKLLLEHLQFVSRRAELDLFVPMQKVHLYAVAQAFHLRVISHLRLDEHLGHPRPRILQSVEGLIK